jgi:hypothetical protein
VWLAVWRESRLDNAIGDIERITRRHLSEMGEQPEAPDPADAWADRDDRWRRRWLVVQGALLLATGLAMGLYHVSAAWLIAALIAAQGVYFLWRERSARTAPTIEAGEGAKPARSTVNAAWFSLFAGSLVWTAAGLDRLQG